MAQATQGYRSEPSHNQPRLSPDEKRIADAVIRALDEKITDFKNTQDHHTKLLCDLRREMRGVNQILSDANIIPYDPDL